ncbi:hypothetical protein M422DRAFT_186323, partial [Sphaerobolus stellatus SS14]
LIAIDSTFLSPFYVSPLAVPFPAVLAVHSITKYINGHSDVFMGAVILPNASTAQANSILQNAHGAVPGAIDAWLALRGAKTLSLRMKEHGRSDKPGATPCASDWQRRLPLRRMVSFRIGRVGALVDDGAAERSLTRTRLFTLAESLGGVESLAVPEKMAHEIIPPAERLALGITPDLVRLSVGVEGVDDLTADVEQALSRAINEWNNTSISAAFSDLERS